MTAARLSYYELKAEACYLPVQKDMTWRERLKPLAVTSGMIGDFQSACMACAADCVHARSICSPNLAASQVAMQRMPLLELNGAQNSTEDQVIKLPAAAEGAGAVDPASVGAQQVCCRYQQPQYGKKQLSRRIYAVSSCHRSPYHQWLSHGCSPYRSQ